MKRTHKAVIALCILLGALTLSGCGTVQPDVPFEDVPNEVYALSAADLTVDYDTAQSIHIPEDGIFRITQGGAYTLTGEAAGQVWVDTQDEIVFLQLDNAALRSQNGPAIYVESAAKLVLTLKDGTTSSLSDSAFYKGYDKQEACIFSGADLTFNGGGKLEISGFYRDAIRSKDVVKVLGCELDIRAKKHGLRGTDGVILENAQVSLQCEGSGIVATKAGKAGKGFVSIAGGTVGIIAGNTGIDAAENLYIQNAAVTVDGVQEDIACSGTRYVQEGCLQ